LEGRKKKKRKPMKNKWKPMKADRHVSKVNIPEKIHQIKWSDFSRGYHTSLDGVTHINKHQPSASACIRGAARPQTMHHRTLTQLTKPSPTVFNIVFIVNRTAIEEPRVGIDHPTLYASEWIA
jgi:hypothetical protein